MKLNTIKVCSWFFSVCTTIALISCQPDEFGDGNGLSDPNVNASFTVTPIDGEINKYLLEAETENVLGVKWDFGFGAAFGNTIDTVFFPDAGEYTITLTAIGKGGMMNSTSQDVTVLTSDPNAGNLVVGGKMDEGDDSNWEFVTYSAGVSSSIAGGKMVFTGGGWGQSGIYQTVQVEGGKKYKVDMLVSGSGATDTWFEVYVGMAVPVPGSDYNDGGKRLALNTWAGCAKTPFNGKLSVISCDGTNGGVFTFEESGTAYLFIRGGGADLGTTGISIDNVELRGTK
ncbi:MAG TPA: hypothetical protein PLJ60_07915 [Chryseolinea sp.]|nr:hypothetical protein [Chryseolinea sp.]HPH45463.1 hypothetical protein [Chryseolinea sp.]HPM30249.1 hypothetical protein [Chryseolinea sp.]